MFGTLRLSLVAIALAAFFTPAAASCRINLTIEVPRWWDDPTIPRTADGSWGSNAYYAVTLDPRLHIQLDTQRRIGGWEAAWLAHRPNQPVMTRIGQPTGARVVGSRTVTYSSRITTFTSLTSPMVSLPDRIHLVADLEGAGCVADRQFRITYHCSVDSRAHSQLYGHGYNALSQPRTDVLFGGNRVAPRDITFRVNCPRVGPLN